MRTCPKCGAKEQTRKVIVRQFRRRESGPPRGSGWTGPVYPRAALQIYERVTTELFFKCKFICPNRRN